MHPAILFTAHYGPPIAEWIFGHRHQIGESFQSISAPVLDSLSGRGQGVDRIGQVLVAQKDNHTQVIGLLHRHEIKLDGIGRSVDGISEAVDGLAAGQAGLASSLSLLTSLSAVTLGFSILTPALLLGQFRAVHGRLDGLALDIKAIRDQLEIQQSAQLESGLEKLAQACDEGDPDAAAKSRKLDLAYGTLTDIANYYGKHLLSEVDRGPKANCQFAWLLARHAATGALGLTACHLRMGNAPLAAGTLRKALSPLRAHAIAVFDRTVGAGDSPARYLIPAMKEYGVTLESMAELYRQAGHAGVLENARRRSASEFFEDLLRGAPAPARDPRFFKTAAVQKLRCELAEATAAIEEVNRIRGLALALGHCAAHGWEYLELERQILADLGERAPADGSCFAYFPGAGASVPTKSEA